MTSPLTQLIGAQIDRRGAVSVARFMQLALTHPRWGYYKTKMPLGADGDFVTAPEISQIFGEVIGLWCVQVWRALGAPAPFTLMELGPGRGQLMQDCLRAADRCADFAAAREVCFWETSALARAQQKQFVPQARWLGGRTPASQLKAQPLLLLANEFFDALPIRQFCYQRGRWRERALVVQRGRLQFGTSALPRGLPRACLRPSRPPQEGDILEYGAAACALLAPLARHMARYGGAGLVVDYGSAHTAYGDSLQAVHAHRKLSPLAAIGASDVSAHVQFAALAQTARAAKLQVAGPIAQGRFLCALGAAFRARALMRANPQAAAQIWQGLRRLIHPSAMGSLFQVMALHVPNCAVEGFAP